MTSPVYFTTTDGVTIAGAERLVGDGKRWALLLHMMPATKESYAPLMEALADQGVSSLAIDFRGHGESTSGDRGQKLDSTLFSDAEHQASSRDVEAAMAYLEQTHGARGASVVLVGASIGANLALQYGAAHAEVPGMALLSPGLNYRNIVTMPMVDSLRRDRHLYLIASKDDSQSGPAVEKLMERSLAQTDVKLFDGSAHGTDIFSAHPDFVPTLAAWVAARFGNL